MIQASKSPELNVTPCKDIQILVCFLDNEPVFSEAPSPVPQSLLKGMVFSSYEGMLGSFFRSLWPGRSRRNKVAASRFCSISQSP